MSDVIDRLSAALVGRYRVERELGLGGMATVYLAADLKHDRKVALKVLKPELAAVLGAERFVVEIKTTAALQHPHILPLFDSGTADGFLYYVMPFIDGETLRDRLTRETQLGVEEAVKIAREIADALDYAHRHGVIHRDIKPENILLHDGRPMVADFGIALAVSAAAGGRMTETGLSLGTPHYMSPEQATAEKEITARSDVYSLASVLYEILAGAPPHHGGPAQAVIMKIITDTARPLQELRRSVPPNVAAAVAKALEKLPADRFDSAAHFADALANPSFTFGAIGASQPGGVSGARGILGRGTVALVGAAALLLGITGARLLWRERSVTPTTTRLMLEFPANQRPQLPAGGEGTILALLPDDNGLLYVGPGVNARTQFWNRPWDKLQGTRIAETLDEGCCAVLSPHGDSLAYLTSPHQIHVLPLGGGASAAVADSGVASVTDLGGGLDWGPDGWLYVSGLDGLARVSPRGGRLERVTSIDAKRGDLRHIWPAVLPGGRAALVTIFSVRKSSNPERASIGLADFATGKVDVLLRGVRAIYSPTGHVVFAKANGVLWAAPFDVRTLRLTGRERELADTVATADLSLSPGGTLAYIKGVVQSVQAMWVDRNGVARPVAPDLKDFRVLDPALSPDGKRLIVVMAGIDGKRHLWLKPVDGGPRSRLTFDGTQNFRPAWRPGTSAFTFSSDREAAGGKYWLFESDADGTARVRKPELRDPRAIATSTWSPDGKWLVFRTDNQEPGNGDIMAIRPGVDTVARALVATPAEELSPAVSFDGRWLAYSSNESGRQEVYVRPFPEASSARFQVSSASGINPVWNRNGKELFYLDAAYSMIAVPVTTGATFKSGSPQVLFSAAQYISNPFARQYDVMPDGKRFVMLGGEADRTVHVVVVFNFLEELKRRMAAP